MMDRLLKAVADELCNGDF